MKSGSSVTRWWVATGVVVLVTLALEIAFRHLAHAELLWHLLPGFDFVYGLFGCAGIVWLSKWLGKTFVQRPESYYGGEEPE